MVQTRATAVYQIKHTVAAASVTEECSWFGVEEAASETASNGGIRSSATRKDSIQTGEGVNSADVSAEKVRPNFTARV